ncbi:NAD-dependent epimerase/dehydratase family protein [Glacieibacterium frigidum]|uniref:NAD-dependent epimerase/dehydratase family protein n=1 Tax=Glacieibacterium frigidum TaxID=2593303 RepID=A0A552UA48_9SPHN|nr:NAD-dependent epimerase/dehydratase family protein [Glacieibacterium frigidum]TRW15093.1 NAD-dependent epimerase/dehydratase family protein [Glacieibacterium frigidum]
MILAVTGGTGFVGGHLLRLAVAAGHEVRALTRRPQSAQPGVIWVSGDLTHPADLCEGADAVIHLAGVINAPDPAGFFEGNVAGTATMIAVAEAAGVRRFVHVSSLAAREPGLSAYGASKAASERLIEESDLDWSIVRPPGVYGPGDRETLALFQLAKHGIALIPSDGHASMIEASDLSRALLALAAAPATRATHELSDGEPLSHRELAQALGVAVGKRVIPIKVPGWGMAIAATLATTVARLRGGHSRLTAERARYLAHPDWVTRGDNLSALWRPQVALADGLRATADWYRANDWL